MRCGICSASGRVGLFCAPSFSWSGCGAGPGSPCTEVALDFRPIAVCSIGKNVPCAGVCVHISFARGSLWSRSVYGSSTTDNVLTFCVSLFARNRRQRTVARTRVLRRTIRSKLKYVCESWQTDRCELQVRFFRHAVRQQTKG
jgi:hypothetical protein